RRRRDVRRLGGGLVGGAIVVFVAWTATSRIADPAPAPKVAHPMRMSLSEALHGVATTRVPFYFKQLVGQFSYGETPLPFWLVWGWHGMVIALVVLAALLAGWRYRLVNLGLFVSLLGLLTALELYFLPHSGWFSHSRYAMPAGAGLLLLPAFVPRLPALLDRWLPRGTSWAGGTAWVVRGVAVLTALLSIAALAKVASRFQSGPRAPVNPFTGDWLPPTGPVLPLLALALGAALIATLTWWLTAPGAPSDTTTPATPEARVAA
ncbi:MAG: hypothetical protein ACRDTM_05845, partial [Micromonosporaceae bacterium]